MDTLLPDELVAKARDIIEKNRDARRRIALAESCTGGLVGAALTEIPGSSDVFVGSLVTYANSAKHVQLSVPTETLDRCGAVSAETAKAMARGALRISGADVVVSITGIAGPDGGSEEKPVGTVIFARATRGEDKVIIAEEAFANTGRGAIRLQAALAALSLLEP